MIYSFEDRNKYPIDKNPDFKEIYLDRMLEENGPSNMNLYAHVYLKPGEEVHYHEHHGESESYYILSGNGTFNDDGKLISVKKGDLTFTSNGHGHNLVNTGDEILEFMALIIKD